MNTKQQNETRSGRKPANRSSGFHDQFATKINRVGSIRRKNYKKTSRKRRLPQFDVKQAIREGSANSFFALPLKPLGLQPKFASTAAKFRTNNHPRGPEKRQAVQTFPPHRPGDKRMQLQQRKASCRKDKQNKSMSLFQKFQKNSTQKNGNRNQRMHKKKLNVASGTSHNLLPVHLGSCTDVLIAFEVLNPLFRDSQ